MKTSARLTLDSRQVHYGIGNRAVAVLATALCLLASHSAIAYKLPVESGPQGVDGYKVDNMSAVGIGSLIDLDIADMAKTMIKSQTGMNVNLNRRVVCPKALDEKRLAKLERDFERELRIVSREAEKLFNPDDPYQFNPNDRVFVPDGLRRYRVYWKWVEIEAEKKCKGLIDAYWDEYVYPPAVIGSELEKADQNSRLPLLHRNKNTGRGSY